MLARRLEIVKKFAVKTSQNPRFKSWFPEHEPYQYELRVKRKYKEERAKTERLKNNPIFMMRRILNDHD